MAEWRLLRALVSASFWCHLIFNIQADVPIRRPCVRYGAGSSVFVTPSGLVPGGDKDARDLELKIDSGGEDLIAFCHFILRFCA